MCADIWCARFDLRPFLYPQFSWPYKKIQATLEKIMGKEDTEGRAAAQTAGEPTKKDV